MAKGKKNNTTGRRVVKAGNKILAAIIVLVIVITAINSILSYNMMSNNIIKLTEDNLEREVASSEKILANIIADKYQALEYISNLPEIQSMDWEKQEPVLKEKAAPFGFEHIFIMTNEGIGYYAEDGSIKDQSEEEFYQLINGDVRVVTEPYVESEKERSITTLTMPIKDGDTILGTICGVIDLNEINTFVQDIENGESGYGFLVNSNGEFVANKDMSTVYNKVTITDETSEYAGYAGLTEELAAGNTGVKTFKINGEEYLTSFTPLEGTNWLLAITVKQSQVLAVLDRLKVIQLFVAVMAVVLGAVISIFIRKWISRAVGQVNRFAKEMAQYNLTYSDKPRSNDEFGEAVRELNSTVETLNHIVANVYASSENIYEADEKINGMLTDIFGQISETAEAVTNITSSMQESSAALTELNAMAHEVNDHTKVSAQEAGHALSLAKNISNSSERIHCDTVKTKETIENKYIACSEKLKAALEKVKVIENISSMSNLILSVADETSLLALNANIEAARAGEHGKGFAVVAGQVKALSEQTTNAANEIQSSLQDVLNSVQELSGASSELVHMFETDIMQIFDRMLAVAEEYQSSGTSINEIADNFNHIAEVNAAAMNDISTALNELSAAATAVSDNSYKISENMVVVNTNSTQVAEMSRGNIATAQELINAVDKFKIKK